jgi:hypothetical protein
VAGPLVKGSNLCHGTGGNGYAFLKLYRRTGDAVWLERARAFAMTAIAQYREARDHYVARSLFVMDGRHRPRRVSWDCLTTEPHFPTIDVL